MEELKKFCEKIRIRRLNADFTTTTCPFCGTSLKGYDALQAHIFADHKVALPPFDDIEDIDGFLAEVAALAGFGNGAASAGPFKCLHYSHAGTAAAEETFASLSELEAHLATHAVAGATLADPNTRVGDCRFWTWDTVPCIAKYRFYTPDANDDGADDEEEEAINSTTAGAFVPMGDDEVAAEGTRIVEEGCGSTRIECPYCVGSDADGAAFKRYDSDDFTAHLLAAHRIDSFVRMLRAFRGNSSSAPVEFHDMIRLVNMIREKTDDGVAPNSGAKPAADGTLAVLLDSELKTAAAGPSPTPAELASVFVVGSAEFEKLLAEAPNAEFYLLPKRPNDPLITYLLHTDEDDEEEAEEAFPMVPTLREVAAVQPAAAAAADSDSDSD